jgi:murein DD-endopeptidase MepM/ murein hydrolase activator NlpD
MNQHYLVVEFAHSIHGQLRRIQIGHRSLGYALGAVLLVLLCAGALFSSYLRMSWKASRYEALQQDFDHLRARYQELQRVDKQHNDQIASLQTLATEVSARYGIIPPESTISEIEDGADLKPSVQETMQEFSFLKSASVSEIYHQYAFRWETHTRPSLWPVHGTIRSPFGGRPDPFSGEGEFHTGIDISAPEGTPVHVAADGVVTTAGWSGGYGKLVIVNHGNGIETYYAHLSQFLVLPGEEVRAGEIIALSGGTGRATAPHLHYEVRIGGTPVNPVRYLGLGRTRVARVRKVHNDLGL